MRFIVLTIALALAPRAASAQSPIGAWTLVELDVRGGPNPGVRAQTQPSLLVVTPTHYAVMFVTTESSRTRLSSPPTDSELAGAFRGIVINGGTYELDGSTLTRQPTVALWPGFERRALVSEILFEGETMSITDSSRPEVTTTARYERIPSESTLEATLEAQAITGVFRLVETERTGGIYPGKRAHTEPSLLLLTDTHFASMYVGTRDGEEGWTGPLAPRAELGPSPTDAELADAYRSFVASSGSYEFDGSTFEARALVTKNPNGMGGEGALDVLVEGDSLVFSRPLSDGSGLVLRRYERVAPKR